MNWQEFLRALLRNADKIPAIIEAVNGVRTAQGLEAKWAASKVAGDLIVPIVAQVGGLSEDTLPPLSEMEAAASPLGPSGWLESVRWFVETVLPILLRLIEANK